MYLDLQVCTTGPAVYHKASWRLVNVGTGGQVDSGSYCQDKQIDALPAGEYRLEIAVADEATGPYSLELR